LLKKKVKFSKLLKKRKIFKIAEKKQTFKKKFNKKIYPIGVSQLIEDIF